MSALGCYYCGRGIEGGLSLEEQSENLACDQCLRKRTFTALLEARQRIAALEAEVARLRAPVEIDDAMVDRAKGAYAMYTGWHIDLVDWDGMQTALAAALNNEGER